MTTIKEISKLLNINHVTVRLVLSGVRHSDITVPGFVYVSDLSKKNKEFSKKTLEQIKKEIQLSNDTKHNIAKKYNISRNSLYNLIKKHGW